MKTSFWTKLLDLVSPRLCVVCGRRLSPEESVLCPRCMFELPATDFAAHPYDNLMARLFWGQFQIEKAVAMFHYVPQSEHAKIIYELKYHGHPEVGEQMGCLFARQLQATGFFEGIDGIVPMPITRSRRRQRGYNQSEMLARGISEQTGLPIYNNVVERTTFHESQTHVQHFERRENVQKAFRLIDGDAIAGKHLLLVDDIVTTGFSIIACAQQLQQAPDVRISVLTLGKTKT